MVLDTQLNTLRAGQASTITALSAKYSTKERHSLTAVSFAYWREMVGEPKSHPLEAIKS